MTTGTPPRFTQLSRWSPAIDPRNGEDGPRPTRLHTAHHLSPFTLPLISLTSPEPTKHLWLPGSSLSPRGLRDLNPTLPYKHVVATLSLPRNYLTR